eukprot:12845-Heterococcus_DN1.PRE.3
MSNRGEQGDGIYSPNAAAAGSLDFAVTATDKIRHYTALVSGKLSNKVKVPPLRRPAAFFGLGEPKPFSLPSATDVVPRLKQNLPHYASNYGVFYLILCTITIITSPISLMSLTLSGAGWYFVTKAGADPQQDSIKIGSLAIKKQIAYAGMGIVTVLNQMAGEIDPFLLEAA